MKEETTLKPWYKKWWGVILTIMFFPFIVPYLVWSKTTWNKWVKVAITAVCVIFIISSIVGSNQRTAESLDLVEQAETLIDENKISDALKVLDESQKLNTLESANPAFELEEKITKLQSTEFLKNTLVDMSDSDFLLLQNGELKTSFINHEGLNKLFIATLQANIDKRDVYIAEIEAEKKKEQEEAEREAEIKKKEQEEELKRQSETVSQKSAIRKAKSYIEMSGFSRDGLIRQLKYEKFSDEDATYALDNIEVDWNKQAERKAQSYLDMSGFSRDGLIKQLKYEGFTTEQAMSGVTAIGL